MRIVGHGGDLDGPAGGSEGGSGILRGPRAHYLCGTGEDLDEDMLLVQYKINPGQVAPLVHMHLVSLQYFVLLSWSSHALLCSVFTMQC